jgi:hypothetical protein
MQGGGKRNGGAGEGGGRYPSIPRHACMTVFVVDEQILHPMCFIVFVFGNYLAVTLSLAI